MSDKYWCEACADFTEVEIEPPDSTGVYDIMCKSCKLIIVTAKKGELDEIKTNG